MKYKSTRDAAASVSAAQAIVTGLAPDGGLYIPEESGRLLVEELQGKSYPEAAFTILREFLPEFPDDFLRTALVESYGDNFGGKAGHLVRLDEGLYSLELWHGPTAAFKDYALQLLPRLLVKAKELLGLAETTHILVATSGDTGTAALNGFADVPGTAITVFYPEGGTSEVQRLQMATQTGDNVEVVAIHGNFDDAQRGVKLAFNDRGLAEKLAAKNVRLSSANSINWGRLVPQIVYYATSYAALCAEGALAPGDPLDFCVPTGNFGDIMAGFYAKRMGLPVGRLVCAANQNNVLVDFLATGRYDANREFYKTSSPSMDILVSSNLERLLFHASDSDENVRLWMRQLAESGGYEVDAGTLAAIRETFAAGWAGEEAVSAEIARLYQKYNYLADPHTAVAFEVARRKAQKGRPMVVLSTASPFKFSGKVLASLGQPVPEDEFEALHRLEQYSGEKAPASIRSLREKPVRFTEAVDPREVPGIPLR